MRNVVVISPQKWGEMYVSKHHYAIELSKEDNVYFICPPQIGNKQTTIQSSNHKNLSLINYSVNGLFWNYVKFQLPYLFQLYINQKFRAIKKKINLPINEVWCFDDNLTSELSVWRAEKKLYFTADKSNSQQSIKLSQQTNLLVSVNDCLLENKSKSNVPRLTIGHGLSNNHYNRGLKRINERKYNTEIKKIGYVGNLMLSYLNIQVLTKIITKHIYLEFHFFGAYLLEENNVQDTCDEERISKINLLSKLPNVKLHGVLESSKLVDELFKLDAFLMCYDIKNDPNNGSNSHKILEYLSTGKVIIANTVSDYIDLDLFPMLDSSNTHDLESLFDNVVINFEFYNSKEQQSKRIHYAIQKNYRGNISRIRNHLYH